jgi:hypothetical protein
VSNTIRPKTPAVTTPPSTPRPAEAPKTSQATSIAPQGGWKATGTQARQPTEAAKAIAPGTGKNEIICPVLRALVNEGRVKMAPDGAVSVDELNKAVKDLGGSKALGAATWGIGTIGNKPTDILHNIVNREMNVVNLPQGIVPHPADTQILRNGRFDEQKFNALVKHADKNGRMTADSFARAIADNYHRDRDAGAGFIDSAVRGLNFAELEFAGLLAVFGSKDPSTGKMGISVADLRTLYEQGTIPPGMQNQKSGVIEAVALQASLKLKVDANLARDALGSIFTATGLSSAGARLSGGKTAEAEKSAAQLMSMGAGKAANCPHMNNKVKMPDGPAGVVNAHTPAGIQ